MDNSVAESNARASTRSLHVLSSSGPGRESGTLQIVARSLPIKPRSKETQPAHAVTFVSRAGAHASAAGGSMRIVHRSPR